MSEAISWTALKVIKAKLASISTTAGYLTNLGAGLITLDPASIPDEPTTPFTVIVAGDIVDVEGSSSKNTTVSDMDVTIEFAVPFGTDTATVPEMLAHNGLADIRRALRGGLRGSAEGFRKLEILSSRIGSPEDGASIVIAQVTARAGLSESNTPAHP